MLDVKKICQHYELQSCCELKWRKYCKGEKLEKATDNKNGGSRTKEAGKKETRTSRAMPTPILHMSKPDNRFGFPHFSESFTSLVLGPHSVLIFLQKKDLIR